MFQLPDASDWMFWGNGLMIGFPLVVVILSQVAFVLQRQGKTNLLTPLDLFRNSTLFLVFMTILLRIVIGLPQEHLAVRIVDTALQITVINLALAVFNVFFFHGAEGTWRARVPKLLIDIGRLLIVLIWGAYTVSSIWGVDLQALLAALGVGSLVIGLALQDTLGNLFSGIAVISARQFKPGDWIKVGDIEGQVRAINWRSVTVGTSTGDMVVIPNGQIARERLRNFGADKGCSGVLVDFKIPNDQPPQTVLDLIIKTAASSSGILEDPKPVARIVSYDDADIIYRAIFYVRDYKNLNAARTEFLANFWYGASREGVSLPPRPFTLPAGSPSASAKPQAAMSAASLAAKLGALGVFQRSRHKLEAIADQCHVEVYRKGQSLIKSGEPSSRFFVISKGRAAAYLVSRGEKGLIEEFGPGELVLYKAFFRNGGSPFEVEAQVDVELISIPVLDLEGLLTTDFELGAEIERMLSLREEAAGRNALKIRPELINGKSDTSRVDILRDMFKV